MGCDQLAGRSSALTATAVPFTQPTQARAHNTANKVVAREIMPRAAPAIERSARWSSIE
jgi:hypothetical protein